MSEVKDVEIPWWPKVIGGEPYSAAEFCRKLKGFTFRIYTPIWVSGSIVACHTTSIHGPYFGVIKNWRRDARVRSACHVDETVAYRRLTFAPKPM